MIPDMSQEDVHYFRIMYWVQQKMPCMLGEASCSPECIKGLYSTNYTDILMKHEGGEAAFFTHISKSNKCERPLGSFHIVNKL